MTPQRNTSPAVFHIGAVARMTGLSADTIRAWERRYTVVVPTRTPTKHRLYSREDISRLALIKSLVDSGDRIGAVADLSVEQLQERLNTHERQGMSKIKTAPQRVPRVAVLGDVLPARLRRHQPTCEGIEFVLMTRSRSDFEAKLKTVRPDVIVLEYPTVHHQTSSDVQALFRKSGAERAVVIYGFGSQRAVARLDTYQTTPLRAPVDLPELRHILVAASGEHPSALASHANSSRNDRPADYSYVPARRYSDETLALVASADTPVQCECPHHLVDLIRSLLAFETYSAECVNREPADARLHELLHATAAQARSLLEDALTRVAEAEGIAFADRPPSN